MLSNPARESCPLLRLRKRMHDTICKIVRCRRFRDRPNDRFRSLQLFKMCLASRASEYMLFQFDCMCRGQVSVQIIMNERASFLTIHAYRPLLSQTIPIPLVYDTCEERSCFNILAAIFTLQLFPQKLSAAVHPCL